MLLLIAIHHIPTMVEVTVMEVEGEEVVMVDEAIVVVVIIGVDMMMVMVGEVMGAVLDMVVIKIVLLGLLKYFYAFWKNL